MKPGSRQVVALGVIVFAITTCVLFNAPQGQIADSRYSLLLTEHLLRHGDLDLTTEFVRPLDAVRYPGLAPTGYPANMQLLNGKVLYGYPIGTSILSVPLVVPLKLFGVRATAPDGKYSSDGEYQEERIISALLMGTFAVIVLLTGLELIRPALAVAVALAVAFGTQVASTASRALWAHDWLIVLLGAAILLLVRARVRGTSSHPILLATLLSWAYFCRPSASFSIAAVAVYLPIYERRGFLIYAITGAVWLGLFLFVEHGTYGMLLQPYYQSSTYENLPERGLLLKNLSALLFSPSRGLLVTVPLSLAALYLAFRNHAKASMRALRIVALSVIGIQCVLVARYFSGGAFGGSCFGARLLTDLLPWLVLVALIGLSARQGTTTRPGLRWVERAMIVLLMSASVFINMRAAYSPATWLWSSRLSSDPEANRRVVMSWAYPQWLAGLIPPPLPAQLATLPAGEEITFGVVGAERYTRDQFGWTSPDGELRRSVGTRADIVFRTDGGHSSAIELTLEPWIMPQWPQQRVRISLNGRSIGELVLTHGGPETYRFDIPEGALTDSNILTLRFPDARSPRSLHVGEDTNAYAIGLHSLRLLR